VQVQWSWQFHHLIKFSVAPGYASVRQKVKPKLKINSMALFQDIVKIDNGAQFHSEGVSEGVRFASLDFY
jgi:hypothetical protein